MRRNDLSRRRRHRRHLHRHRAARLRRRGAHQEDLLQRRGLCARHRRGARRGLRRDRHRRQRHRGDPPRHDRRLQRHPRAEGRARRPDHHQGLPRRAGDPHAAHAAPLRHRLDQAGAAGRALSAPGGRRAHRPSRAGRARARPGRRRAGGGGAARREGRGDRRLPAQFVRQSGARADAARYRAARARPACRSSRLLRGAARDQGVRAHLDDRHQRLRDADRGDLSAAPCASASTPRAFRRGSCSCSRTAGSPPTRPRSSGP